MSNLSKFAAVLTAAAFLTGCGLDSSYVEPGGDTNAESNYDSAKDVKLTSCKADEFGLVTAKVTITNHDSKPRGYWVTAEAVKGSDRIAELNAVANAVRPGQTTTTEATGSAEGAPKKFTCKVVTVDSYTS